MSKLKCPNPKCNSINIVKKGFTSSGTQRYLCNRCKKRFVIEEVKISEPSIHIVDELAFEKTEYIQTLEKIVKKDTFFDDKTTFDEGSQIKNCGSDCGCKESATASSRQEKPKNFKLKSLVHDYLMSIHAICDCANRINTLLYDSPVLYDYTKHNEYLVLDNNSLRLSKLVNIVQATTLFYTLFGEYPIKHIENLCNMIGDDDFVLDINTLNNELVALKKQLEDGRTNYELVAGCKYLNQLNAALVCYYQYLKAIYGKLMEFVEE